MKKNSEKLVNKKSGTKNPRPEPKFKPHQKIWKYKQLVFEKKKKINFCSAMNHRLIINNSLLIYDEKVCHKNG